MPVCRALTCVRRRETFGTFIQWARDAARIVGRVLQNTANNVIILLQQQSINGKQENEIRLLSILFDSLSS